MLAKTFFIYSYIYIYNIHNRLSKKVLASIGRKLKISVYLYHTYIYAYIYINIYIYIYAYTYTHIFHFLFDNRDTIMSPDTNNVF